MEATWNCLQVLKSFTFVLPKRITQRQALRVSITIISQTEAGKTIIFVADGTETHDVAGYGSAVHSGVNNVNSDGVYLMDGKNYYSDPVNETIAEKYDDQYVVVPTTTTVANLKDYMGGFDTNPDGGAPNETNTLFALNGSNQVWVTIRIWAEGTHPNCTEEIAGSQINLKLKFGAAEVEQAN